jgi:hypothetical protein
MTFSPFSRHFHCNVTIFSPQFIQITPELLFRTVSVSVHYKDQMFCCARKL